MNSSSPFNESPTSFGCTTARDSFHLYLDGDLPVETPESLEHRSRCASCRAWEQSLRLMLNTLANASSERPRAGLADRVLESLKTQPVQPRSTARRWLAASLALAASIALAFFVMQPREKPADPVPAAMVVAPPVVEPRNASLNESVNEANDAVAALTRKADKSLTLNLPSLTLPKLEMQADPLERLEPAVASIQDVRHGVVLSLTPMANSARKAADLFWKEVAADTGAKPSMN